MRVILDTAVLITAARSRNGASYASLSMLPSKQFDIALTVALYTEWESELTRPEHLPPGVSAKDAMGFLRYLASIAHLQDVHFLWRPFLRDPDDDMVLEFAVAFGCKYIITHHVKDFKRATELNVRALTPAEFLTLWRNTA